MADEEQVKRLLAGVEGWNKWRKENPNVEIDLTDAKLEEAHLPDVNLTNAKLNRAVLVSAYLGKANLEAADLTESNLEGATMSDSILVNADLTRADLRNAILGFADLNGAHLDNANLEDAYFFDANLTQAYLVETKFSGTHLWNTKFIEVDLGKAKSLENAHHTGRSSVSISTIQLSGGKIPEAFLRGCGLSDLDIEYAKLYREELSTKEVNDIVYRIYDLRTNRPIQINPLFISYSHKDSTFVDEMENHLNMKGIRFWRDIHDASAGRLEKVIDLAIRQNPTVLLVLSENSVQSDWVEHEARSARELEKELKRDVLCPVALDGAWKDCPWPARLREQVMEYNILDFSNWKDEAEFTKKFAKLVEGLDLFYKE